MEIECIELYVSNHKEPKPFFVKYFGATADDIMKKITEWKEV